MGLGTSIFLIAVGAILKFAVNWQVNEIDLQAVGVILMIIGALGLVLSLIFWNSWGGFGRRDLIVDGGTLAACCSRRIRGLTRHWAGAVAAGGTSGHLVADVRTEVRPPFLLEPVRGPHGGLSRRGCVLSPPSSSSSNSAFVSSEISGSSWTRSLCFGMATVYPS